MLFGAMTKTHPSSHSGSGKQMSTHAEPPIILAFLKYQEQMK